VLPYIKPKTHMDIQQFWKQHVEKLGYEGLVIRNNSETAKLKPKGELDAVLIAINKKSGYGKANMFSQQQVTSLHLALMTPQGEYVEIGDCASGINHQLRTSLYKLMQFKIAEGNDKVWIKPFLIVNVEYTDLFQSQNKVYQYDGKQYRQTKTTPLIKMRHPRLISFRGEKKATPQDIGLNQIPQKLLEQNQKQDNEANPTRSGSNMSEENKLYPANLSTKELKRRY
jgi:ATP-dependent DNA ligase